MPKKIKFGKKSRAPLALVIIAIVAISALALGVGTGMIILDELPLGDSAANCAFAYSMYGTDDDGNIVEIPTGDGLFQSGFSINGIAVSSITVKVAWEADGEGIDWETFSVDVVIEVYRAWLKIEGIGQEDGPWYTPQYSLINTIPYSSDTVQGEWLKPFVMGTDLATDSSTQIDGAWLGKPGISGQGWYYTFKAIVTVSANDIIGELKTASDPLGMFGIWVTLDTTLNVKGTVSTD